MTKHSRTYWTTPEGAARLRELWLDETQPLKAQAAKVGLTASGLAYHAEKAGLPPRSPRPTWPEARTEQFRQLWLAGTPRHEVGAIMGMSAGYVSTRARELGISTHPERMAILNARAAAKKEATRKARNERQNLARARKRAAAWSEETEATARTMWLGGHTATEIGAVIGRSRSAVLGWVKRKGLTRGSNAPTRPRRRAAKADRKPAKARKVAKVRGPLLKPLPPPSRPLHELPPRPEEGSPLFDTTPPDGCRYYVGDVGSGYWCGRPTIERGRTRAWCADCYRIVYQPPAARRASAKPHNRPRYSVLSGVKLSG